MLATTTSVEDSGLLDALLQQFRIDHPEYRLATVAVGTGEALEYGRRGDADVLLSHDAPAESLLVVQGVATRRAPVMHNDFIIAGPAADPAVVQRDTSAVDALLRIAAARATFISRGDDSGTHRREKALWKLAGRTPNAQQDTWYIEAGLGMGDALRLASERNAYILTDRGTYLVQRPTLQLVPLVEGDPLLINRYGVTTIARSRNSRGGEVFAQWVTSAPVQNLIAHFGVSRYGQSLFIPDVLPNASAGEMPQ